MYCIRLFLYVCLLFSNLKEIIFCLWYMLANIIFVVLLKCSFFMWNMMRKIQEEKFREQKAAYLILAFKNSANFNKTDVTKLYGTRL